MNDNIRFVLDCAIKAPSGDNTQPWRWIVRGETLELWDSSPDQPVCNYEHRSSNIALGAVIENAVIAASVRGLRTDVTYFPDSSRQLHVANLQFVEDATVISDPLASALADRCTDRKPYRRDPLSIIERETLSRCAENSGLGELKLVDDARSIDALARAASLHDEFMFSNDLAHEFLFSRINWTKREDSRKRVGFYFPTLESPPFSWGAMQLLRHWWIMRIGSALGLHHLIASEQRAVYRHSGGYGIVLIRSGTLVDWVKAGRLVERVWLSATTLQLSVQPMTGVIFMSASTKTEAGQTVFSPQERARLEIARSEIAKVFEISDQTIAFMFRIGHGKPPSARTSRLPFEKVVTIET